jgi:hypothetical protein
MSCIGHDVIIKWETVWGKYQVCEKGDQVTPPLQGQQYMLISTGSSNVGDTHSGISGSTKNTGPQRTVSGFNSCLPWNWNSCKKHRNSL